MGWVGRAPVLTFALAAFAAFWAPDAASAIGLCGKGKRITCVVDADTFWLKGEKFRAVGYDTPEADSRYQCGGAIEDSLAEQATRRFLEILNTSRITVERRGKDDYGRTLAIVRSNGVNVGDILIGERLARRWPDGREFWCPNG